MGIYLICVYINITMSELRYSLNFTVGFNFVFRKKKKILSSISFLSSFPVKVVFPQYFLKLLKLRKQLYAETISFFLSPPPQKKLSKYNFFNTESFFLYSFL